MFIVCKTCSSSYHIPSEIFGDAPRQFRCSGCGRSWEAARSRHARRARRLDAGRCGGGRPRAGAAAGVRTASGGAGAQTAAPLAAVSLVAGSMGAIGARQAVVAAVPLAAGAYAAVGLPVNVRGLDIGAVRARMTDSGDKKVLVVEGAITNLREGETAAPDLRIALRAGDGRELYVWTTRAPKTAWRKAKACALRPVSPRRRRGLGTHW